MGIPLSKPLDDRGMFRPEWVQYLNNAGPQVQPVDFGAAGTFIPGDSPRSFRVLLSGNLTIGNPTNVPTGANLQIELVQDFLGGHTITLGTAYKFPGGVVPAWATTANAINLLTAYFDGTYFLCGGGAGYA